MKAKIDTTKDFIKHIGSLRKASSFVSTLLTDERLDFKSSMYGRRIHSAGGSQKNFEWVYNPTYKTVRVTYTDNRTQAEPKDKPEYYVIWIEGLTPQRGEKILSLKGGNTYTTRMTQAMRVLPEDRQVVKEMLRKSGVADWVLQNCMVRTNYAPKGTIFKL
jgi:hypothetical protein